MTVSKVGVYIGSDTVRYHLAHFKHYSIFSESSTHRDLEEFRNSVYARRFAILQIPFPFSPEFELQVADLLKICDHIFVLGTEIHPPIVRFIQNNDNPRITYYICGFLNFEMQHSQVHPFMDWFETSSYFYRRWLPELLTRLNPFQSKHRAFDILLGRKKQHRDIIYHYSQKSPDYSITTYFVDYDISFSTDPQHWQWEMDGVKIEKSPEWTVDRVQYYGHPMSVSQILPITIYNQTAYSVIAETCWQDNFAFFTEKTSKPIIARRLFVMFAGRGYLANLRRLGFRTFGEIIDESYDDISDALIRWRQAWDQVLWLAQQPQEHILELIRPIVEHNFHVMMNTDWTDLFRQQLEQDFVRIAHG
jgi:hypothetical protein